MRYREENELTYHAYKVIILTNSSVARQYIDTAKGWEILHPK